jgi:hypothetical protein
MQDSTIGARSSDACVACTQHSGAAAGGTFVHWQKCMQKRIHTAMPGQKCARVRKLHRGPNIAPLRVNSAMKASNRSGQFEIAVAAKTATADILSVTDLGTCSRHVCRCSAGTCSPADTP